MVMAVKRKSSSPLNACSFCKETPLHLKYAGPEDRYYPTLGITPIPGDVYELDHNPDDGQWATTEEAVTPPEEEVENA